MVFCKSGVHRSVAFAHLLMHALHLMGMHFPQCVVQNISWRRHLGKCQKTRKPCTECKSMHPDHGVMADYVLMAIEHYGPQLQDFDAHLEWSDL